MVYKPFLLYLPCDLMKIFLSSIKNKVLVHKLDNDDVDEPKIKLTVCPRRIDTQSKICFYKKIQKFYTIIVKFVKMRYS